MEQQERKANGAFSLKNILIVAAGLAAAAAIVLARPLGMNRNQSVVVAAIVMVVLWWSTGAVHKIIASAVLLALFLVFGSAPPATVFKFALSESFPMIALTYLFSQGIANSRLVEKLLEPLLFRYVTTPLRAVASLLIVYFPMMVFIPQPLARLILVAVIFNNFIGKTNAPEKTRHALMFSIFMLYAILNMMFLGADLILNVAATAFAGLSLGALEWAKYMAVPGLVYVFLVLGLLLQMFRKDLLGVRFRPEEGTPPRQAGLTRRDKWVLALIVGTVLLWGTSALHGINATLITCVGTALMFAAGVLRPKDFRAIDVTMLVFLTAAMAIGAVMTTSGAADIVFSAVARFFPARLSAGYIVVMVCVSMVMHLMLGSNTTTLSVLLPGFVILSTGVLPPPITLFVSYISVASHYLFPYNAVGMMIGCSNNYFPQKYITRFGLRMTLLVFIAILCVFIPWWRLIGAMP